MVPMPRHTAMLSQSLAAHRNKAPTRGLSHEQTPPFARLTLDGDATPAITRCPAPRPPPYRCTQSTVPAKQAPPHRPSTLTTLMPPPRLRRAAASKIVTPTHAAGSPPPPSGPAHGRPAAYACYEGVKRRARPCPVKHLSRRGATTPLSPLPHWLHGGQGHCAAALAAATQPWWSGGGDSLTSRPRPREGISKLSL